MTDARTQALAARYSVTYGSEDDNDHFRAQKPPTDRQTVADCPTCGTKATVLEDRVPALLDRWQREHERMDHGTLEAS